MKIILMALSIIISLLIGHLSFAAIIINTGEDFKLATANLEDQTFHEQLAEWVKFEYKYISVYDNVVYEKHRGGWEARQELKRNEFFFMLPEIKAKMIEIFDSAEELVVEKEARFKTLFADLPNVPVYFLPSMNGFNGKVTSVLGQPALFIGVDVVASRNDNLDVLFSHEFFHAYHSTKIANGEVGTTMASPLWREGFATYVSSLLNPEQNDEALLMDTALTQACSDKKFIGDIAKQFLTIISANGDLDYADWFLKEGGTQPSRRGYCLGLQVVREIAKKNEVKEMITWGEARFSAEISTVLQEFTK